MIERKSGLYKHETYGEIDVYPYDGGWMWGKLQDSGNWLLDEDWGKMKYLGPATPMKLDYNPDLGTLAFLEGQGYREVWLCDTCGVRLDRRELDDYNWPSEVCPRCPTGQLHRHMEKPAGST